METTKTKTDKEELTVHVNEVLSYNMGGYIYKVAYKQIDKLDDYADESNITHWFRTAKSLWRKVKASLLLSKKEKDFITKTDDVIKAITQDLKKDSGKSVSRQEQIDRKQHKYSLVEKLEQFEQNIYEGMTKIKMWIPTTKDYDSPEDEFKDNF